MTTDPPDLDDDHRAYLLKHAIYEHDGDPLPNNDPILRIAAALVTHYGTYANPVLTPDGAIELARIAHDALTETTP